MGPTASLGETSPGLVADAQLVYNVRIERRASVTACYESLPKSIGKQIDKHTEGLRSHRSLNKR